MSRALGDHSFKGPGGGVSPDPHCVTHIVQPDDLALVLATDGVWDVCSEAEARPAATPHHHAAALPSSTSPPQVHTLVTKALASTPPSRVAAADMSDAIVKLAITKGTHDNTSALVILL